MFSQGLATGTVADNHTNIEQNQDNLVPGSKTTQKIHTFSELNNIHVQKNLTVNSLEMK